MSNVEYRCPECGGKFFAAPGGTKLKCRHHAEAKLVQVEGYNGPDFFYVDEDGKTRTGDRIGQGNARAIAGPEPTSPPVTMDPVNPDDEIRVAREMYELVAQGPVDKRWSLPRIKEEIELIVRPPVEEPAPVERSEPEAGIPEFEEFARLALVPTGQGVIVDAIPEPTEGDTDNGTS